MPGNFLRNQKGFSAVIILVVVLVILSVLAYFLFGKYKTPTKTESIGKSAEKIVIGVKSAPLGFYGQDSVEYESPTFNFNANIFEGLTTFDKDLKFASRQLVESWDNPSDTTWRLRLRQGVKFHDGSLFDAEDAKASVDFAKKYVVKDDLALIKDVKVIDQYTIEINTDGPNPLLLNNLVNAFVLPKEVIDSKKFDVPIGTGPYKFVNKNGNDYTLSANDDYYLGKAKVANVDYRIIENNDDRVNALLSGQVDLIEDVPANRISDIEGNKDLEFKGAPSLRVIFLGMDVLSNKLKYSKASDNPFKKLAVRQAIYKAIDEETIVKEVMGGHAYPASQLATSVNFGFNPDLKRPTYDPEGAKKLLSDAGYPNGFDIVLDVPNNRYQNDEAIGKKVVEQLTKVGIKATLNSMSKDDYFPKILDNKDTSFYLLGWSQDNGDAGGAYATLVHTFNEEKGYGGFNIGGFSNADLDKAIEQSDKTVDSVARLKMLQNIAEMTMSNTTDIPLHQQEDSFAVKKIFKWVPRRDNGIRAFEISLL